MSSKRVLTGITTTGTPHLGNYLGAIKPAIEASTHADIDSFFFLADFHALIKCQDPERVASSTREIAATWLALGLDTENATFYRQTDIPETTELTWILTCMCSKGLMNRSHAYKAAVDANREAGREDPDDGVTMGLFSYPILMAADILAFNAEWIPVGKDQIQHIEMARDIAGRFNHTYEPLFTLPKAQIDEDNQLIPGLDGRKMSKSYDNTIPLFCSAKELQRQINRIKTDLREPGEPKDAATSTVFQLYSCFASEQEQAAFRREFEKGIAWGEAKSNLFDFLNERLEEPRKRYHDLINNLGEVERTLKLGAERARDEAAPLLEKVRIAAGIRPLTYVPPQKVVTDQAESKEQSDEAIARAEEGRRRAILRQVQPLIDRVQQAEDSALEAELVIAEKRTEIEGLKKKARQKAENELQALESEFSELLK